MTLLFNCEKTIFPRAKIDYFGYKDTNFSDHGENEIFRCVLNSNKKVISSYSL
jgi:hypothetical protein